MNVIIDENVSLGLANPLRLAGYRFLTVVEDFRKGYSDDDVWNAAKSLNALLITRDYHFTNRIRFNPIEIFAILYLRQGNLGSNEEIKLVTDFLCNYDSDKYHSKLIVLSRDSIRIRE